MARSYFSFKAPLVDTWVPCLPVGVRAGCGGRQAACSDVEGSVFPAAQFGRILLLVSVPKERTRGSPLRMDGCVPAVLVPSVDSGKG